MKGNACDGGERKGHGSSVLTAGVAQGCSSVKAN